MSRSPCGKTDAPREVFITHDEWVNNWEAIYDKKKKKEKEKKKKRCKDCTCDDPSKPCSKTKDK